MSVQSHETMSPAIREAYRYHQWVFQSFAKHLRPGVALEIGSGHGIYARHILESPQVDELIVSDIDPRAIEAIRLELAGQARARFVVMDGIEPDKLGCSVDNVVLLNVLEHITDDEQLLRRGHEILRRDGVVIVFAPAFARLYGRMDREAGHHRRYERGELGAVLERSGFEVIDLRYFNTVGFFGWWVNKWMSSPIDSAGTNLQVKIYDRLVPFLRRADGIIPLGQSLIAVGAKRS
jgi:SAM-dependent methyltransferase